MSQVVDNQVLQEVFGELLKDIQIFIDGAENGRVSSALEGMDKYGNPDAFAECKKKFCEYTFSKHAYECSKRVTVRARDAILDKAIEVK